MSPYEQTVTITELLTCYQLASFKALVTFLDTDIAAQFRHIDSFSKFNWFFYQSKSLLSNIIGRLVGKSKHLGVTIQFWHASFGSITIGNRFFISYWAIVFSLIFHNYINFNTQLYCSELNKLLFRYQLTADIEDLQSLILLSKIIYNYCDALLLQYI